MNAPSDPHIYSLPNELFVHILSPFPTSSLLPLATVSHRFHALILRILHYRLLISASLNEYKLILECFHPSSKLIEPHVFCKYLGTDGLSDQHEGKGSLYENVDTAQQLARLGSLYSRFRPEVTVEERSSGTRLIPSTSKTFASRITGVRLTPEDTIEQPDDLLVTRPINLEANEDFSQLCVVVNVVKVMPGSNLLLSAVTVEDGVIRLFRNWLKTRTKHSNQPSGFSSPAGRLDKNIGSFSNEDSSHLLWVGQSQNVGLKVRVREKVDQSRHFPILVHRDEEESTSYELDIEELHIRTTRLLMTTEQSLEQQDYLKAVIFTGNSR